MSQSRREFLGVSVGVLLASASPAAAQGRRLQATPACGDGAATPSQTEGPFFKPSSPRRTSLIDPGMPGTRILLEGRVLGTDCSPVPGALLDFWQAGADGGYDNAGFRLRGHQFSDDAGRYRLETVVPGLYTGRTRHFHVKVQAANQPPLTTQLYFPNEPANRRDFIFSPRLVMDVRDTDGGKLATFDFVVTRRTA